ncbi:MAG: hypothetical protein OXC01_06350 [Immundisolibacterales bacterium]|nr:hypothetical protein [Immundisolibacterales bacterium]
MSTGSFENWAGNIAEIGPIYPFVGAEWLFVLIGVVYWIVWHVRQLGNENQSLADQEQRLKAGTLSKTQGD